MFPPVVRALALANLALEPAGKLARPSVIIEEPAGILPASEID
jgi:hypothetical protein